MAKKIYELSELPDAWSRYKKRQAKKGLAFGSVADPNAMPSVMWMFDNLRKIRSANELIADLWEKREMIAVHPSIFIGGDPRAGGLLTQAVYQEYTATCTEYPGESIWRYELVSPDRAMEIFNRRTGGGWGLDGSPDVYPGHRYPFYTNGDQLALMLAGVTLAKRQSLPGMYVEHIPLGERQPLWQRDGHECPVELTFERWQGAVSRMRAERRERAVRRRGRAA